MSENKFNLVFAVVLSVCLVLVLVLYASAQVGDVPVEDSQSQERPVQDMSAIDEATRKKDKSSLPDVYELLNGKLDSISRKIDQIQDQCVR